jgi:hypothetical protein
MKRQWLWVLAPFLMVAAAEAVMPPSTSLTPPEETTQTPLPENLRSQVEMILQELKLNRNDLEALKVSMINMEQRLGHMESLLDTPVKLPYDKSSR